MLQQQLMIKQTDLSHSRLLPFRGHSLSLFGKKASGKWAVMSRIFFVSLYSGGWWPLLCCLKLCEQPGLLMGWPQHAQVVQMYHFNTSVLLCFIRCCPVRSNLLPGGGAIFIACFTARESQPQSGLCRREGLSVLQLHCDITEVNQCMKLRLHRQSNSHFEDPFNPF